MSPPIEVAVGLLDEGIPAMLDDLEEYLKGGNRAVRYSKQPRLSKKIRNV